MRLIDSSIRVPPRSFTPQRSDSVAASRPIFTQLACRLAIVRPSARRKTAVCLRFSSREISSTPCVRPSSVWKGMNESGTNSVIPPVRSCSSRTTRMCSASSQGSSMWPNMTVAVERRPAAWEASMISTQRATGSLFGEMRARTPSCSTSAAVPGVERPVRVNPRLDAQLGRAVVERLLDPPHEVGLVVLVGVGRALALAKAAEGAADRADVGDVDVAVDDEGDELARELEAQLIRGLAHLLDRLRPGLGEHRRQLLRAERAPVAP